MKNLYLFSFIFLLFSLVSAQNSDDAIEVGEIFVIQSAENHNYEHIYFPKANLIQKKGGIANFSNLVGEKVEVISIKEKKNGQMVGTLKLISGKAFFNSHRKVKADILKAIEAGELVRD